MKVWLTFARRVAVAYAAEVEDREQAQKLGEALVKSDWLTEELCEKLDDCSEEDYYLDSVIEMPAEIEALVRQGHGLDWDTEGVAKLVEKYDLGI